MNQKLLTFEDTKLGIQKVILDVSALYPDAKKRKQFEDNYLKFSEADSYHSSVFGRADDLITYQTECILPTRNDQRPPLLLVFGNPASHSVASEMFFSYEGKKGKEKEHRIWKMLSEAKILSFPSTAKIKSIDKVNRLRKKALYDLSYCSPFRIGLAVFYSMPSLASNPRWSGVTGLRRLFGKEALTKIGKCEKVRIDGIISKFVSPSGAVIAFQKDAYLAIKSPAPESPEYTLEKAKAGSLVGKCQCDSNISLFCLPPTRLFYDKKVIGLLREVCSQVLNKK